MSKINSNLISDFIINNVSENYHNKKENKIDSLKLTDITKRKNPYLFRAKGTLAASDLIKFIMEATVSSGEETIFGNFMECIAIYTCNLAFNGRKSSSTGIDLEFEKEKTKYLVSIKSGPNWGNSSQIKKLKDNFLKAKRILNTSGGIPSENVVCIEGCCYGTESKIDKGTHIKLCGQDFWTLISDGNTNLYKDIIQPFGEHAYERNENLQDKINKKLNTFTGEFIEKYCFKDGSIDWIKLIEDNSGSRSSFSNNYK